MSTALLAPPSTGRRGPPRGPLFVPPSSKRPLSSTRTSIPRTADEEPRTSGPHSLSLESGVKEFAAMRAKNEGITLASKIREGWDAFVDGRFTVHAPIKAPHGTADKAKLTQWESDSYWTTLTKACKKATGTVGAKVTPSAVAEQYLVAWLRTPEVVTATTTDPANAVLRPRDVYLNADVKEAAVAQAAAEGFPLAAKIREGWNNFITGQVPAPSATRAPRHSGAAKQRVMVQETDEYWQTVVAACERAAADKGERVTPSTIAEQHLAEWLNLATRPATVEPDKESLVTHTLYLPSSVKEAAKRWAKDNRVPLVQELRKGFDAFLAGDLVVDARPGPLAPDDTTARLVVNLTNEYWQSLLNACKRDTDRLQSRVSPSVVADLYLRHLLGLPTTGGNAG